MFQVANVAHLWRRTCCSKPIVVIVIILENGCNPLGLYRFNLWFWDNTTSKKKYHMLEVDFKNQNELCGIYIDSNTKIAQVVKFTTWMSCDIGVAFSMVGYWITQFCAIVVIMDKLTCTSHLHLGLPNLFHEICVFQ